MNFILMADVIESSEKDGKSLMLDFKELVREINMQYKQDLLSPLTITLGDEFQGVVKNLRKSLEIIFSLEESIILKKHNFKLRYVLNQGEIDTDLNPEYAHEMLGSGLTNARNMLNGMKSGDERFNVNVQPFSLTNSLNKAFLLFQSFYDDWSDKQLKTVAAFLEHRDYKQVAKLLGKDSSSVWRREKSLKIKEYFTAKELILSLAA
ncbi:SatD family protein [Fulvivirgaceae bacterium BMA10]|uniref:SatD family protein n=1 Tax=Splendidivirga corallicola TaxID=3051826 RepID=A0ABT8KS78_9BACT|nr:SatD family protein [Fulvivirgaceae bacterium BMA10]